VLDAVMESAARLYEALDASILHVDGDRLRSVAHHGPISLGRVGEHTIPLVRGTTGGRAVLDRRTVYVADIPVASLEFVPLMREKASQSARSNSVAPRSSRHASASSWRH
jgi:hypothetical protein